MAERFKVERDRAKAHIERYQIDQPEMLVRLIGHDLLTGEPFDLVVVAPDMALALQEYFVKRYPMVRAGTSAQ